MASVGRQWIKVTLGVKIASMIQCEMCRLIQEHIMNTAYVPWMRWTARD